MTGVIARIFYRFVGGNTMIPVTLGLRNIYILPTGYGLLYLAVLGAMLVGSINYNNNLGFLLTFLLGSLGMTAMLYTYSMLYGLRLAAATAMPVFAGQPVAVEIRVAGLDRPRRGIDWFFDAKDRITMAFKPGESARVRVGARAERRGRFTPGWLRITCGYPMGLFTAWSRINTNVHCLVYPKPIAVALPEALPLPVHGEGAGGSMAGVDDFQGLSAYRPGDSPGRIHWQSYSRGRGLHIKTFASGAGAGLVLDMHQIKGDDTEKKLSILCFHVLRAHRQQQPFSLELNGQSIPVGSGQVHRERCLQALALFGSR